jgi:hypothetical protein
MAYKVIHNQLNYIKFVPKCKRLEMLRCQFDSFLVRQCCRASLSVDFKTPFCVNSVKKKKKVFNFTFITIL